jgi:hypothetical protein
MGSGRQGQDQDAERAERESIPANQDMGQPLLNGAARGGTGGPKRPAAFGQTSGSRRLNKGRANDGAPEDVSRVSERLPGDANAVWMTVLVVAEPSLFGSKSQRDARDGAAR